MTQAFVTQTPLKTKTCLTVGGSDSCGGAGIQADLRVFESLKVKACSATTALTAQNPNTIVHIQGSSITQFQAELQAISDYYDITCIKTGMLFDHAHINALLPFVKHAKLVIDPVLIASSGTYLFEKETAKEAYASLIAQATLWTPNLQEARFFLGDSYDKMFESDAMDAIEIASALVLKYQKPVLLKGGHGKGQVLQDVYCDIDGNMDIFKHPKQSLNQQQTHGTGCRLASAITAHLALDFSLTEAIQKAKSWLQADLRER